MAIAVKVLIWKRKRKKFRKPPVKGFQTEKLDQNEKKKLNCKIEKQGNELSGPSFPNFFRSSSDQKLEDKARPGETNILFFTFGGPSRTFSEHTDFLSTYL